MAYQLTDVLADVLDLKRRPRGSIIAPSSLVTRNGLPTNCLTLNERAHLKEVMAKATELQIVELVFSPVGSNVWSVDPETVSHLNPNEYRIALRRR